MALCIGRCFCNCLRIKSAEGVRFELTRPFGLPVFKTGAINRSATPPSGKWIREECAIAANLSKRETMPEEKMRNHERAQNSKRRRTDNVAEIMCADVHPRESYQNRDWETGEANTP